MTSKDASKKPAVKRTAKAGTAKPKTTRKKGTKEKPEALQKKVRQTLEQLESEGKGLEDMAREDPKWFYEKILKPMLPKSLDQGPDGLSGGEEHELIRVILEWNSAGTKK